MLISLYKFWQSQWLLKIIENQLKQVELEKRLLVDKTEIEHQRQLLALKNSLEVEKIEAELAQEKAKLALLKKEQEQLSMSVRVVEFDSGPWSGESGAINDLEQKMKTFQLQNGYKYATTLNEWSLKAADSVYKYHRKRKVVFGNHLYEVLDPKEEAIKLIIQEAVEVIPQLLVHPNEEVRKLVEKFHKKGDKNDSRGA